MNRVAAICMTQSCAITCGFIAGCDEHNVTLVVARNLKGFTFGGYVRFQSQRHTRQYPLSLCALDVLQAMRSWAMKPSGRLFVEGCTTPCDCVCNPLSFCCDMNATGDFIFSLGPSDPQKITVDFHWITNVADYIDTPQWQWPQWGGDWHHQDGPGHGPHRGLTFGTNGHLADENGYCWLGNKLPLRDNDICGGPTGKDNSWGYPMGFHMEVWYPRTGR